MPVYYPSKFVTQVKKYLETWQMSLDQHLGVATEKPQIIFPSKTFFIPSSLSANQLLTANRREYLLYLIENVTKNGKATIHTHHDIKLEHQFGDFLFTQDKEAVETVEVSMIKSFNPFKQRSNYLIRFDFTTYKGNSMQQVYFIIHMQNGKMFSEEAEFNQPVNEALFELTLRVLEVLDNAFAFIS